MENDTLNGVGPIQNQAAFSLKLFIFFSSYSCTYCDNAHLCDSLNNEFDIDCVWWPENV